MSDKLTRGQSAVLAFIRDFTADNGFPPTDRDIQTGMGFSSSSTARHHLAILERKGSIQRQPGKARGIILPGSRAAGAQPLLSIPLLGGITAGLPAEGIENFESCIMVD